MERPAGLLLALVVVLGGTLPSEAQDAARPPLVIVAELDGIIHPVAAEYLSSVIDTAAADGAGAVVIVLRTPGGLLESTRTIVSRFITSSVPIVVFVAPSGARAASAGFFLAVAADVAAMAPGTHIGAAHPVAGNGQPMDDTVSEKAASDAAAYVRSLATARGRNVALAEAAVLESRAFTDTEAAQASPPLVDLIAKDLDDLLRQLDGRTIRRFDGRQHTLHTAGAEQRRVGMTRRQQVLSAIAHPQVAYLLLSLGLLGLTVELWNPGAVLPGVVGGVSLLMAFFAFQILPVSVAGLLLIVLGASLLVAELLAPSFGILGIGGAVALFFGSVMVTDTVPGIRVRYELIVPVVVALAGITLFLGRLALRAQRQAPATGVEGLIGSIGQAMTALGTDVPGQIGIHGEIWRAVSRTPVAPGDRVRVLQVNGLTLVVEAVEPHAEEGGSSWTSRPSSS
jgi:membrane-bound serine protease (ClpP class)